MHLILRPRERGAKNNNQLPLRSSAASGRVCAGRSSHQHLTLPSSIPLLCNLGLCMREGSKASSYFFKGFSKGGLCCEFSPTLPISCCPGLLKDAPVLHLKPHLPFTEELTKVPSVSVKRWQYYRKKAVKSIPVNKGGDHPFRAASAFPSSDEQSPAVADLQDCWWQQPLPWQCIFVLLVITFSCATLRSGTDQLWAMMSKKSHLWLQLCFKLLIL